MDKTYKTELRRIFLLENLPEPLTRASFHLQLFDNYIEKTRLRLRFERNPETKNQTRILQQKFPVKENDLSVWNTSQIYLNENEYKILEKFEGREIRKNRYFYEYDGKHFEIDIYLGQLWGLNIAKINFKDEMEMKDFKTPPFTVFEITNHKFFTGEVLVNKNFADVQDEFEMINGNS